MKKIIYTGQTIDATNMLGSQLQTGDTLFQGDGLMIENEDGDLRQMTDSEINEFMNGVDFGNGIGILSQSDWQVA